MKPTHPLTIVVLATVGALVAGFAEWALTASGQPLVLPPLTLAAAMAIIGIAVVLLALPVRRSVRSAERTLVDPFYATRVLVLGKASAIAGALFTGFAVGALIFMLTRSVVPVGSVSIVIAAIVSAALLLAGGLVAEWCCRVPPPGDDDDETPPTAATLL